MCVVHVCIRIAVHSERCQSLPQRSLIIKIPPHDVWTMVDVIIKRVKVISRSCHTGEEEARGGATEGAKFPVCTGDQAAESACG